MIPPSYPYDPPHHTHMFELSYPMIELSYPYGRTTILRLKPLNVAHGVGLLDSQSVINAPDQLWHRELAAVAGEGGLDVVLNYVRPVIIYIFKYVHIQPAVICFTKGVYEIIHDGGHRVDGCVDLRHDLRQLLR